MTIGIVSAGAMGSAVGASLMRGGARVVTTIAGRSERTARLAARAELELLPNLGSVLRAADVVISIVPPEPASTLAGDIARAAEAEGTRPLLVELNAVAPATVREIEAAAADYGIDLVDGSVSGPPPWKTGTRVYLSGRRAEEVAALPFDGVERIVVGDGVGSASAVKMSTASAYKGSTAILVQALLAAQANGVLKHVLDDLRAGAPELVSNVERRLAFAAAKSGRYVGEMREIASSQDAAGLTPALFEAMAEIYAGVAGSPLARSAPEEIPGDLVLDDVLRRLRD